MEADVYQRHTNYRTCTKKSYEIHSERLYLMLQIKTIATKIATTIMHWLELQDIMYLVKCLKSPQNTMIAQLVSFTSSTSIIHIK